MRNLLNPKWIFVLNTLPIVILFFLFAGEFNIIKSLLNRESIFFWKMFTRILGILGFLNGAYAVYLVFKKKNVSFAYGIIALVCYISFIYFYSMHLEDLVPFSIPRWLVSGNIFLYAGTFLMPTLVYSLFILVVHFTPEDKQFKSWKSFLFAVLVPVAWYVFVQVVMPIWRADSRFTEHTFLILMIVSVVFFLFFLIRGIFILINKKTEAWRKYQLIWKIPISIVLPLLGLAVNNGYLFDIFGSDSEIFGDFSNFWFYLLAVINGVLLCLPDLEKKFYRLFLFIGRSITFAYTFYFFLVFLPFLPLSIVAIIAIGTGFLMLTPLALFVIHIQALSKDFHFLKNCFPKNRALVTLFAGFLVIPAGITVNYLKDKRVLNEALEYIYTPNYAKAYNLDRKSLQKTLKTIEYQKDKNGRVLSENKLPYLSAYFNWLVLDNLTLSDVKINTIEQVFFGSASLELNPDFIRNGNVEISDIAVNSVYDQSQGAWISRIDLEITNHNNEFLSEYATTIDLPEGCWISDYYLYVGDKKEYGILAEKKSAMWVFSQIRNENRDPGILYYLTGNKVAFRIFPFAKNEVRKTGIEFLHREPVKLNIGGNTVELGDPGEDRNYGFENENMLYVPALKKQALKQVQRKPYFHFLVDVSLGKDSCRADFIRRIEQLTKTRKDLSENAQISFVNSYATSFSLGDEWKDNYQSRTFEGGFYLDRAIKTALFNAYVKNSDSYPVLVVVTNSMQEAVWDKDFSDFQMTFPENNLFFYLDESGILHAHSLSVNPWVQLPDTLNFSFEKTVLQYKSDGGFVAYLPDNGKPDLLLKKPFPVVNEVDIKEKDWTSALAMQGEWISQILHPETSGNEWLNLVKYSFISKVMMPVTSYLVVENEAQKAILKKKQEQVLSSNKSLDTDEETQRMTEPGLMIPLILLGFVLWCRNRMKTKNKK